VKVPFLELLPTYKELQLEFDAGRLVGTFGLYDIRDGMGVPGRWVMYPDTGFLIAAPVVLAYQFAFEILELDKITLNVVASNRKVLKFHRLFGARETHVESEGQVINGMPVDFVWFEVTKQAWPALYARWNNIIS
jgi:hypothetical protein